jgi:uncharacterized delta-60 repeat protein
MSCARQHRQSNRNTRRRATASAFEPLESRQLMSGGGELDPSFNRNGVNFVVPVPSDVRYVGSDVAVQVDGKTVVTGTTYSQYVTQFLTARFNADGTIDKTFGPHHDGTVYTQVGGNRTEASALAIQPDGKIVVVGTLDINGAGWDGSDYHSEFAIARYNSDGSLDTSFDGDGKKTIQVNDMSNAYDVVIQRDGKIVVAGGDYSGGMTWSGYVANTDFAAVRLNPNGSMDKSFDGDGKVTIAMGDEEDAHAVTIDYTGTAQTNPNYGKIVLAGRHDEYGRSWMVVARLNTNGSRDKTFDHTRGLPDTGYNIDPFLGHKNAALNGVLMQADGKIVVAGWTGDDDAGSNQFALVRYDANGKLDRTFGTSGNGMVETGFGGADFGQDIVASADGGMIVGGLVNGSFALAAYDANGKLNSAFGTDGKVKLSLGDFKGGGSVGLATTPDGRLVIAGGHNFATARVFQERPRLRIATEQNGSESRPREGSVLITRDSAALPLRVYLNIDGNATLDQDYTTNLSGTGSSMAAARTRGLKLGNLGGGILGGGIFGGGGVIQLFSTPYIDMAAGQKSVAVRIITIDDTALEPLEAAAFTLVPNLMYSIEPGLNLATIPIEDDDQVHINFQTSNRFPPPGYAADLGSVYGDRGAGLTFGWDADNTANARSRRNNGSPDPRYDTFNHMQLNGANRKWEIAVPNGTYQVRIVAGDPTDTTAVYKMNLEGTLALFAGMAGTPAGTRWFRSTSNVLVTDGRLTLSNAAGAVNNKIAFIDIKSAPMYATPGLVGSPAPVTLYSAATASNWTKKPNGLFSDKQIDETLWT